MSKVTITRGMASGIPKSRMKGKCDQCDLTIPIYPGRYPGVCPNCSAPLALAPSRDPLEPVEESSAVRNNSEEEGLISSIVSGSMSVQDAVSHHLKETTVSGNIACPPMPMAIPPEDDFTPRAPVDRSRKRRPGVPRMISPLYWENS